MRIKFLSDLYLATARWNRNDADALARIEYAAFIGFLSIEGDASDADKRQTYEAFLRLTDRAA